MNTFLIADLIFSVGILAAAVYLYLEIVKLKVISKDITTIYKQISDIILHMDKTDKALKGLTTNMDKLAKVVNSLLPAEPVLKVVTDSKPVKATAKRGRKKKTTEE
jgi:predicted transposase YbfD/YdcC